MKTNQAGWSRRYQAALRKHVRQGPTSSLQPALALGRQAAVLGLDTLDVARVHESALATLKSSTGSEHLLKKRAERFFAAVVTPIEATHRAARTAGRHEKQLTAKLGRRTTRLAASRKRLKLRIAQRRSTEKDLKKSGEHYAALLKESQVLQKHLRALARRVILAHEQERAKVSTELHDEIAQTLLGINVRLLTLKTGANADARDLKKEVASTQRLVKKSARLMARYTRELGLHHET